VAIGAEIIVRKMCCFRVYLRVAVACCWRVSAWYVSMILLERGETCEVVILCVFLILLCVLGVLGTDMWFGFFDGMLIFLKYAVSLCGIDDLQCSCSWCHFTYVLYGFPFSRDRSEYLVPLCGIGDLRCNVVW
jgi:hypothetical protein